MAYLASYKKTHLASTFFLFILMLFFLKIDIHAQDGSYINDYNAKKESNLFLVREIDVDSLGNIYISTDYNINVYNSSGEFLHALEVRGAKFYNVIIDDKDNVHILIEDKKIIILDNKGILIEKQDVTNNESLRREFKKNILIAKDKDNNFYRLSDIPGFTKVTKITPDGKKTVVVKIKSKHLVSALILPTIFLIIFTSILIINIKRLRIKLS